jgi:hypothetical protein
LLSLSLPLSQSPPPLYLSLFSLHPNQREMRPLRGERDNGEGCCLRKALPVFSWWKLGERKWLLLSKYFNTLKLIIGKLHGTYLFLYCYI